VRWTRKKASECHLDAAKSGESTSDSRLKYVLTNEPGDNDRNLYTAVSRTTSLRGSQWELVMDKPFFDRHGAFDFQQIQSIDAVHFESRMGALTTAEMATVSEFLQRRLLTS
jgi:mRNA-degrading endonuclease toxin of MazEF toxin-antitoxin module